MKLLGTFAILVTFSFINTGCLKQAGAAADTAADDSGSSSGGGSGGSSTPTYGMDCTTTNGGDKLDSTVSGGYNVFYLSQTPTGSSISSVAMNVYIGPSSGGAALTGGTTYSTPMTLKAYTCGSSGSLGSLVGTASATMGLNQVHRTVTFTFSSPIAIPGSGACAGGQTPLVFEFTGTANISSYMLWGESIGANTSCYANRSSSQSGVATTGRAWTSTITANP